MHGIVGRAVRWFFFFVSSHFLFALSLLLLATQNEQSNSHSGRISCVAGPVERGRRIVSTLLRSGEGKKPARGKTHKNLHLVEIEIKLAQQNGWLVGPSLLPRVECERLDYEMCIAYASNSRTPHAAALVPGM
uniref:Putative secreted protein n=1 Tax=Anopheles darlingi TaxID=43151 RepID=A0A2M4DG94_ANODA